jgi:ribosome-associated protein
VDDLKPSKSARKREYLARQKLGEELIPLQEDDLRSLGLDGNLLDAVLEAKRMKKHGALRRQKQYIGKLMGRIDPEPVREALERLRRTDKQ